MNYNTPSDTLMGNIGNQEELIKQIKTTRIQGDNIDVDLGHATIVGITANSVDPFLQPIVVEEGSELVVAVDVRHAVDVKHGDAKIRNKVEYSLAMLRANMVANWLAEGTREYRGAYRITGLTFVGLLSGLLTRSFNLDLGQTSALNALLADYYNNLLIDKSLDEVARLSGILKFSLGNSKTSEALANKAFTYPEGITSLAEHIKTTGISPKLNKLTPALLLTLTANAYFGFNAKNNMAIGIEYPPILAVATYTVLTANTFKQTLLAKSALKLARVKGSGAEEFVKKLNRMQLSLLKEK